ncbi:4-(cytidine 5'-diphospho)-2-C-methyl-D-erythritol kinase [candidate division KSB3 bacterium]|uniref:4-diphosphocytidyl-2-C-methyl-D-erythritol kinase n=1 Tax=candidate division KSB3 bacterium TaxID=2044937 RepID=A0A2G6KEP6_9BACT|nr:MAG: 4-(cytidine 5'-diphospho)-2-C-methyl-D-erythritol kinase [candidate division KSB3 bacterium]
MPTSYDLRLASHAKINLGLSVLRKRKDGYHDIQTIFQEIAFHDTLYFRKRSGAFSLTTDTADLPTGDDNLVFQAVRLLKKHTGCPGTVAIHIEKRIPLGAGLGGGSSNAAATLTGLNRLFQLGLSQQRLACLGAELGSDVAFFLYGGTALGTGRGEQIHLLPNFPDAWIVLINPGIHVSSAWAYKNINLKLTNSQSIFSVSRQFKTGDITEISFERLENGFEEPVMERYPIIRSIKAQLYEHGAEWALMSGSGSTVFGIFRKEDIAEEALRHIERTNWLGVVTRIHHRE